MMITKTTICLSDYSLKPVMVWGDILYAMAKMEEEFGEKYFRKVTEEVYFNLNKMKVNSIFYYQQYFNGDKLGLFLVVAHRFISDNPEYEFKNDYSAIRRTDNSQMIALQTKQLARCEAAKTKE